MSLDWRRFSPVLLWGLGLQAIIGQLLITNFLNVAICLDFYLNDSDPLALPPMRLWSITDPILSYGLPGVLALIGDIVFKKQNPWSPYLTIQSWNRIKSLFSGGPKN